MAPVTLPAVPSPARLVRSSYGTCLGMAVVSCDADPAKVGGLVLERVQAMPVAENDLQREISPTLFLLSIPTQARPEGAFD